MATLLIFYDVNMATDAGCVPIKYAVVWPEKSEKRHSELQVVRTSDLRHFNPKTKKDFDYTKFLRLKSAKHKHAVLVQVLALDGKSFPITTRAGGFPTFIPIRRAWKYFLQFKIERK